MKRQQDVLIIEHDGSISDDYGDALLGWYWAFVGAQGLPMSGLMGPYETAKEAEAASQRALDRGE